VLGKFVDAMVIVGGWVPELLYPGKGHSGSLDVDVALDGRKLSNLLVYETVRNTLIREGYRPKQEVPNVFVRHVGRESTIVEVRLDLITGDYDGTILEQPTELIQGIAVSKLRGIEIGLDACFDVQIEGMMPGGERITRKARVPTAAAFICIKAIAMQERRKEKDAYDIYFCMANDPIGPRLLGETCACLEASTSVSAAVEALRMDFSAIDRNGPIWAGRFAAAHGADMAFIQRDAFERAQVFLRGYDAVIGDRAE